MAGTGFAFFNASWVDISEIAQMELSVSCM
jgi:hypothetical protein